MKGLSWALLIVCLLAGQAAGAESAIEAMTAFGLLGSWSLDGCGSQSLYEVSPSGQPMNRRVVGPNRPGHGMTVEIDIQAATRVADDKIRMISTMRPLSSGSTLRSGQQPGERWEIVLMKSGDRYRTVSAQREDGQKIAVEDGFAVRPEEPNQFPTNWIRTKQKTPWYEKCTATGEPVVSSGVIVRSDVSGYAVTFPTQPKAEVKDTPVGKLTLNVAQVDNNMFLLSEAALIVPDATTELESSVPGFVRSFPGAIVTSKERIAFTTASGRTLPATTFRFTNSLIPDMSPAFYGEGIVVASGRNLIAAVGIDTSISRKTEISHTRLVIKKFLSSFRIE